MSFDRSFWHGLLQSTGGATYAEHAGVTRITVNLAKASHLVGEVAAKVGGVKHAQRLLVGDMLAPVLCSGRTSLIYH